MNKERKLKCKQVWGKQIKLNNIPWTNTCNNSFTIHVIIVYIQYLEVQHCLKAQCKTLLSENLDTSSGVQR